MPNRLPLVLPLTAGVGLLTAVGLASYYCDIYVGNFTRDPLTIAAKHPLLGFVSTFGCGAWCIAFAVNLLAWLCISRDRDVANRATKLAFVGYGGLLSLALLLDDQFQLHEHILPVYLGISELIVTATYAIATVAYLLIFRTQIQSVGAAPLIASVILFALSLLVDRLPAETLPMHHLFEDGPKFVGVLAWASFHVSSTVTLLTERDRT